MEMLTPNIYTDTTIRGCNPSIVFTTEGSVFIDTAQLVTPLLEMRAFAKKRGPIKYLINTEGHIDHVFGNHWFAGETQVIGHERLKDVFWIPGGDVENCYDYSLDIIQRQDPEGLSAMPSCEDFVVNPPQITFSDRMSFRLGETTFDLYHTPGHSKSQICVVVPEERIAFTGDTLFSECQTWLHSADIDELLASLKFLETLDVDYFVPGHGPVVKKEFVSSQRAFIYEWISAVAQGIEKGWSLEHCTANISFAERCPVDIGQADKMEYIQRTNVAKCYRYLTNQ